MRANQWSSGCRAIRVPNRALKSTGKVFTAVMPSYSPTSVPAYASAKAGVIALTRSAAHDLAPHGVTVNCVAPGVIATDRIAERLSRMRGDRPSEIRSQIPLGRWGEPGEVAAAIAFLCGPEAGFITGHTIDVNGGAWMN